VRLKGESIHRPDQTQEELIESIFRVVQRIDNAKASWPKDYRSRVGYQTSIENLIPLCRRLTRPNAAREQARTYTASLGKANV